MICPHCHRETEETKVEINTEPVVIRGKGYSVRRAGRIGGRYTYASQEEFRQRLEAVPVLIVEEVKK